MNKKPMKKYKIAVLDDYQNAALVRLFHPLLHAGLARRTEMTIFRQLWAAHCRSRAGTIRRTDPAVFRFQANRKCFNTQSVLEHSLENRETVECISQFAMLLRVCDRQSP